MKLGKQRVNGFHMANSLKSIIEALKADDDGHSKLVFSFVWSTLLFVVLTHTFEENVFSCNCDTFITHDFISYE